MGTKTIADYLQAARERAEINRNVRDCVRHARRALVERMDAEVRPLLVGVATSVLAELVCDRFDDNALADWLADLLDAAIEQRDAAQLPSEAAEVDSVRMTFLVELAKWLFPTFGHQQSYRDEIARLRIWPHPFHGRGEA